MDIAINFTLGFTEGVVWPWPIALYLFLAGISGGAVAAAALESLLTGKRALDTPVVKASSTIGTVMIILGMACLVADLTNPLNFWRILVYYNKTSVMSIGVMALLCYIPLCCVMMAVALWGTIGKILPAFIANPVGRVVTLTKEKFAGLLLALLLVFSVTICAYTGFLISALVRFPIISTSALPALFVASGLSAGIAGTQLLAAGVYGEDRESRLMHVLHKAEWPVMASEALCILMIAVALITGTAAAREAAAAFVSGPWAREFWIGAVGVGFLIPTAIGLIRAKGAAAFYVSALCSVAGMMCLRLFIIYAGQLAGM